MATETKPRHERQGKAQQAKEKDAAPTGQRMTVHQERQARARSMLHELEKMLPQFAAALPGHITPERFKRTCMTAYNGNPDLIDAEPRSFLQSCMKCAQDGLIPDGRQAALVIFKGRVQYMPMIGGIIDRASRTGDIASITVEVAYEGDAFEVVLGDDAKIIHKMALKDRGDPIAAYAIVRTKQEGIYREIMTVDDIEDVRAISRAKDEDSPWFKWWGEMARKTVLRRLLKKVPSSSELMRLLDRDNYQYDLSNRRTGPDPTAQLEHERTLPPEAFELVDMSDAETIEGEIVNTEEREKEPVSQATDEPQQIDVQPRDNAIPGAEKSDFPGDWPKNQGGATPK